MAINRVKTEEKFREVYERLNEQQRKAVDQIEGPVMVIAGPGTGKTQILASRIGKILLETQADPDNILCLTYTDAGVVAMRKRLLQFIGPDAYRVNLYTFHAFCNDVIQENLSLFEKTALDPISDLERVQLLKQLIDRFPKNHPLKRYRGDVYFEVKRLAALFSNMKREGWTPEFLLGKIAEYEASLPEREEYIYKRATKNAKKGDINQTKLDGELDRMKTLRAAVEEFPNYQQLMREQNRYDFDDMINWVIRAFQENEALLVSYQERFQYILVDEYQDTSGTQSRIVDLLIHYWDNPNVFVVGDDDQSIYRFQGANIENMAAFAEGHKQTLNTIVLTNNYRSSQPILDAAKAVIDRNEERLVKKLQGLSKELTSSHPERLTVTDPPTLSEYASPQQEMVGIARSIKELIDEGVAPGRISVIYTKNAYNEEIAKFLRLLGVPVFSKRHQDILALPLGKKILTLLRYLAAEHDTAFGGDELLFEILHYDWFGIRPIDIAKLSVEVAGRQFGENRTSIRALLIEKITAPAKDLFTQPFNPQLKKASEILEKLISEVPNLTLQQLFEAAIRETGLLSGIMKSPDKHQQLQVLSAFFNFLKEETQRRPQMDLREFIGLIDLMEKEGMKVSLVQVQGSDHGVNLLTAHGSKGLEFEHVFVAGCVAKNWEKKRSPSVTYSLPDNLFDTGDGSALEELRRLFYVAMTRAETRLHISYASADSEAKELEPSMFIAEIQDQYQLPATKVSISEADEDFFNELLFSQTIAPEIEAAEEDFIRPLLDKFVMNVTALNNYLHCPLEFYFRNLVRIPSPKNEATEFGSAVHYALEQLFRKMQASGNDQFPPQEEFYQDFVWYMHRHRESFTQEQFERRLEYGSEVLKNYYETHIHQFNKIVAIERMIQRVVVGGVPLKGKLDKLEFDGKMVNVVDYKTGDPDKGRNKMKAPNEKDPLGGDYWRQAVFYKILIDNYEARDWQAVSTEFDFVEPDKNKQYRREKLFIAATDISAVTAQITETWEKIMNREFYTGCGKEDCYWCNFVKTNELSVALHQIAEPEDADED